MSIYHKITDLSTLLNPSQAVRSNLTGSIAIISLVSLSINFLFPHLVLASYAGKISALTFDFSNPAKIAHYAFANSNDLSAKESQKNKDNGINYKVLSALVEIKQEEAAEAIKDNDKNTLARKQEAGIKKEKPAVKSAVGNNENSSNINDKTAYVPVSGEFRVKSAKKVTITAYSSTPDQTDSTPFITASNKHVRDGIVAANFLPFGAKIRIPEIFGDKIFVVEDRMRSNVKVDIWFPTRQEALNFGARYSQIEILEAL